MRLTKIDITTSIIMLSIAFMVDLVEIILTLFAVGAIIEIITGIFQYGVFALWFYFHGSHFFMKKGASKPSAGGSASETQITDMKISGGQIAAIIFESIPIVGALPIFTFSVASKIIEVNKAVKEQEGVEENENVTRMSTNNIEKNPNVLQYAKNTNPQNQPGAPTIDQNSNVIQLKNQNNMKKAA